MKHPLRLLFAGLLTLVLTTSSRAQIGAGAIAPNFVATDINGNTWNLYDILDQGKTVYLDVFATWCGPCWSYHNSGDLDNFYDQYGPDGTDEIMAFMIEGDGSTTMADLQGTGGSTTGNWIAGTPMPIIDNSGIASDFQIRYFPTIFMICPDRIVREVGQLSTADLNTVRAECSIATAQNDAGITRSIPYLNGTPAACGNLNLNYRLCNYGTDPLTSATITLSDGATTIGTYNWSGSLATYESTVLSFSGVDGAVGPNTVFVASSLPNGQADANAANDERSIDFTIFNDVGGPAVNESFAAAMVPPAGWAELNGGDPAGWEYSAAGLGGAGSAKMNFVSSPAGEFDALVLPTMDLTGYDNAVLTFDIAAARYNNSNDNIKIKVSSNCGLNWTTVYNKTGASLATVGSVSTVFTPSNAGQWRAESISLNNYLNRSAVIIKIEALSNQGNNAYIDNVNLSLTTGLSTVNRGVDFSLFPNPSRAYSFVKFTLAEKSAASLSLIDPMGRVVFATEAAPLDPGEHQLIVPTAGLASGIYLVRLQTGSGHELRRLAVE